MVCAENVCWGKRITLSLSEMKENNFYQFNIYIKNVLVWNY